MAFDLETIRQAAQRVAASHGLDVVDVEFSGGAKHRMLRVFIEKNAATRERLAAEAQSGAGDSALPGGVAVEQLAGVTHEDCEIFSRDFGTLVDVEDLVPGSEYTLEISSPGLDRRIANPEEFRRFRGSLVKLQTYTPVNGNRHWQGRLVESDETRILLDPSAVKQKRVKKGAAKAAAPAERLEIETGNIEKANLIPEI